MGINRTSVELKRQDPGMRGKHNTGINRTSVELKQENIGYLIGYLSAY